MTETRLMVLDASRRHYRGRSQPQLCGHCCAWIGMEVRLEDPCHPQRREATGRERVLASIALRAAGEEVEGG